MGRLTRELVVAGLIPRLGTAAYQSWMTCLTPFEEVGVSRGISLTVMVVQW